MACAYRSYGAVLLLMASCCLYPVGAGLLSLVGPPGGPFSFININYLLADPTPEPGSFVLVGTGALLLTRRLRTCIRHPMTQPVSPFSSGR